MIKRFSIGVLAVLVAASLTGCEEPGRRHGPDTVGSATQMMGMRFPGKKKTESKNDDVTKMCVVLGGCLTTIIASNRKRVFSKS